MGGDVRELGGGGIEPKLGEPLGKMGFAVFANKRSW